MNKLSKQIQNTKITDVLLFLVLVLRFTAYEHAILSQVSNILFYGFAAMILLEKKGDFRIYAVSVVYGLFGLMSLVSYLYSVSPDETLVRATSIIELIPPVFAALNYFSEKANIRKFSYMFMISAVICCGYIAVSENIFSGGPVGRSIGNQNQVATNIALAMVFVVYSMIVRFKWWKVPVAMLLVMFIILSGSRSALIVTLISCSFMFVLGFKAKKKSVGVAVILALALVLLVVFLIFNVEVLYNAIGERLSEALDLFQTGEGDVSTNKRAGLINNGWQMFMERPIFGSGLGSFIFIYEDLLGLVLYSHNNYLELLVGIGFVGTAIYYTIYVLCLRSSFDLLSKSNRRTALKGALAFSIMVAIFVSDFFSVNYYNKIDIIILTFVYGMYISEKESQT